MKTKYDRSEGICQAQAAKLLNCRVEDISKYKLTKLLPRAPFRQPGMKTYHYLRSEINDLVNS